MKTQILMAALVAGVVMTAGAASAQGFGGEHGERPDFATLDANGDGGITLDELQAQGAARFAEHDTDGDGALSAEELIAAANGRAADRAAQMIARLDANDDGVLQQEEMRPRGGDMGARMFGRVDADNDGILTEAEFEAAMDRHGDHRGHGMRDRG